MKSPTMFIDTFIEDDDDKYSKIKEELHYVSIVSWSILIFIILLILAISLTR